MHPLSFTKLLCQVLSSLKVILSFRKLVKFCPVSDYVKFLKLKSVLYVIVLRMIENFFIILRPMCLQSEEMNGKNISELKIVLFIILKG